MLRGKKCSPSCKKIRIAGGLALHRKMNTEITNANEGGKHEKCRIDMQRKGATSTGGRSLCGVGAIAEEYDQFGDPSHHEITEKA